MFVHCCEYMGCVGELVYNKESVCVSFVWHGLEWAELPAQKHAEYGRAAERLRDRKQEQLASDMRDTKDEIIAAEKLQQASLKCEPFNIR